MSRIAITLKFMCLLLDKACSLAEKLPDEDNNFGGFLVSDFKKSRRPVQRKNN